MLKTTVRTVGAFLGLCLVSSLAHGFQQTVAAKFLYTDYATSPPGFETVAAAFAAAENRWEVHETFPDGSWNQVTLLNLHPATSGSVGYTLNGNWYEHYYDYKYCSFRPGESVVCSTSPNWGIIEAHAVCPTGSGLLTQVNSPTSKTVYCPITQPDIQPPPDCSASCVGNPVYPATGLKIQVETDYAGVLGLNFERTYRSGNGFFASTTRSAFVDYSQAWGTIFPACFPFYYVDPWTQVKTGYCFPYISIAQTQYQLATRDGRFIQFSGSVGSITQNADINERVTQTTNPLGAIEWRVKRQDDSTEVYNAAGALIQKILKNGQTTSYTYSDASTPSSIAPSPGFLLTETDDFGHKLNWEYDALGRMVKMKDPAGGTYQYAYDNVSNLTNVTYPDSSSKTYHYNEPAYTSGASLPNALTGITDEAGARFAIFSYNSSGRAIGTQHAGGVDNFALSYNVPAHSATVTDPLGTNKTYQFQTILSYERDKNITKPAASGNGTVTQSWTYDSNGNPSQLTDFNGNVTTYSYDTTRNLELSRTEASGTARARTITTQWHTTYRLPTLISVYVGGSASGTPLRTTSFTHDSSGNVLTKTVTDTTVTPNESRTWTYTYDSYGRVLTEDGPRSSVSDITTYTYYTCTTGYQCGQVATVTNALNQVTTYNTYNAHGQPLTITDPNGVVTTLTYDARQRLTSRQVGSETTTFDYWPTGLLKKVTLPDSSYIQYTYDAAHRLTNITDSLGNHIDYTLDAMGNRTAENVYDPSSFLTRTRTRVFNNLSQLWKEIGAAGTAAVTTVFAYDNNGNQTTINAPLSHNTVNAYDELNRLKQITDPANGVTQFAYDANDNLTSVTDPRNLVTSYTYNGFGEVMTQSSPDTGTTTNAYDSNGNLKTSTDARGAITTYAYDALNRPTSAAFKIGTTTDQTITFTYDAGTNGKGHLTGASDANHSLSWTYDAQGRIIGKGQTVGTTTKSVGYGYTNGNQTSVVMPSGQTVTYGYTHGRITSIAINGTTLLSNVLYEPFGAVRQWTWGNGSLTVRTYDQDGRISQIDSKEQTVFTHDDASRITGIANTGNSALSWTYGYDALDRLTSAATTAKTFGWTYDANGNRLSQTGTSASTYTLSGTSNRLSSISGAVSRSYTYNAVGSTLTFAGNTATYNNRGRMKTLNNGTSTATYVYDALGQLIKQTGGSSGSKLYMYDEAGHMLGEYGTTGTLVRETVWFGDIPVAAITPKTGGVDINYIHTDQINTPRAVTRPSDNALRWRWDLEPFGTGAENTNPAGLGTYIVNLHLPGQLGDSQAGLMQNHFRDYDPVTGRYIESDPIGLLGGINTYLYAAADPISFIDPDGLAERGGGQKGLGGNDPLIPRDVNKNTPRETVNKAIERIKDAIKRDPGMNPARKQALKAWMKWAKRGWTKAVACPPLIEDLVKNTLVEMCSQGDLMSCRVLSDFYPEEFTGT